MPLLPDAAKVSGDDAKKRLGKVREALAEELEKASLVASRVTIQGQGIRLTEALKLVQSQTGNRMTDLREANGADVTNPAMDLDIKDTPFFEALDQIAKKAEISLDFATGDGTIGIMAARRPACPTDRRGPASADDPLLRARSASCSSRSPRPRLRSARAAANAQFEVAWEPRLRPMLLALKAEDIEDRRRPGQDRHADGRQRVRPTSSSGPRTRWPR